MQAICEKCGGIYPPFGHCEPCRIEDEFWQFDEAGIVTPEQIAALKKRPLSRDIVVIQNPVCKTNFLEEYLSEPLPSRPLAVPNFFGRNSPPDYFDFPEKSPKGEGEIAAIFKEAEKNCLIEPVKDENHCRAYKTSFDGKFVGEDE